MTESETDDKVEPPVVTGESMIPPTEVSWSVHQKGGFVNLSMTSHSRTVGHHLMTDPLEAKELANRLKMVARKIEGEVETDND